MKQTVAIIGGGPAGATLAALLAQRGERFTPVLFADERTPDLVVGESLIPAIVPLLRTLGIEERVARISQKKPGVSFVHPDLADIDFCFQTVNGVLPAYAYNVPRPAFDRLLAERAAELGVAKIKQRAQVVPDGRGGLRLSDATLESAPMLKGRQPDWLVDASGRARLFSKKLGLHATQGPRHDVAYFAHYQGCQQAKGAGQVIINKLAKGWSWRIPLPDDRLSMGVVLNREDAALLGDTPEERLGAAIEGDPHLHAAAVGAKRVTAVKTYSNYQLISDGGHGPGWVLLGDAYGFVDPMLSPGLFLAMESANLLDRALAQGGTPEAIAHYVWRFDQWLHAWQELIQYFYDGRLFALQASGQKILQDAPWNPAARFMQRHLYRHLACMTAGAWTTRRYSRRLLSFTSRYLIWGVKRPEEMAIA